MHVAEYYWTAAHAFHPVGSREAETWAADKLTAILAGHAGRAAAEMAAQAAAEQLPTTRRTAVTTCHRYLRDYKREECQCALAGKSPWMFVRRQRSNGQVAWVAAHLPLTHAATPQESDKHKAMKERIARTAERHGLSVETEARSENGRVITDVLVTGAGAQGRPPPAARGRTASRVGGLPACQSTSLVGEEAGADA